MLPYLPFAPILGLTPLPPVFLGLIAVIVAMYIVSGEFAKHAFYRHFERVRTARP